MNREIPIIITKVLSGEASETEKKTLLNWFHENEANLRNFAQMESIWNALEILNSSAEINVEESYRRLKQNIDAGYPVKSDERRKLPLSDYFVRIAAILVVVILLPFSLHHFFSGKNGKSVRNFEMTTPMGSRSLVTLPDGTTIWLNADSRLTYPERFEGKTREVYLEGEGYFKVAKDRKHPFIVKTSGINIRVFGTTFNVKSYPSENIIQTTLIEGSVVIEDNTKGVGNANTIELKPNQRATFMRRSGTFSEPVDVKPDEPGQKSKQVSVLEKNIKVDKDINTVAITSWKDNSLYFDNEMFQSIAVKLERRFGVTISFTDREIENFRFSGRFDQISIEEALSALQYASEFKYTIDKEKIYIGTKTGKPATPGAR